jgi:ankyrin repeat protein
MLKPRRFCWLWLLLGLLTSGCSSYSKEQNQEMQRIRDEVLANPQSINSLVERGNTRLHLAVINNYLPLMDWLQSHGANPNVKGLYGDTPLHVAIISDRTPDGRVVRRLLSMGADVNARNNYGDTPLHRAAYHGLTSLARLLLKNKADIAARAQRGETPLLYAVRPEGHPETVVALLEAGADANAADDRGMTPLHGAAMTGNVRVARLLIDRGGAKLNQQTADGYTPLHVAAIFGKSEFVQFLLNEGANRDLRDKRNLKPVEAALQFPALSYTERGKRAVDTSAAITALQNYSPAASRKPAQKPK